MNLSHPSSPPRTRRPLLLTVLVATVAMVAGLLAGTLSAALAAPERGTYVPEGHTVLEVTGDKVEGFTVYRYDGTTISPPTDSEARAECDEHDDQIDRVRCRTEVRVWYRDLMTLKKAINYAQSQAKADD